MHHSQTHRYNNKEYILKRLLLSLDVFRRGGGGYIKFPTDSLIHLTSTPFVHSIFYLKFLGKLPAYIQ